MSHGQPGHNEEGSLLSQLKSEGLAEGLYRGPAWAGRGELFSVGISLTEKGVANYQRVMQLFSPIWTCCGSRGAAVALR